MSFLLIKEVVLCQPFLQNSFIKLLYCAQSIISARKSLFKIGQGSKSSIQKDNFHGTFSQYKITGFCGALNQDEVQDLISLMDGCNYFSTGFRQNMYYCIGYGADKSGFWFFSLFPMIRSRTGVLLLVPCFPGDRMQKVSHAQSKYDLWGSESVLS